MVPLSLSCRSGEGEGASPSRLVSMSTSPSSSVSVSGLELAADVEVDGPAEALGTFSRDRCTRRVVVPGWSQTGRAIIVPLRSRPGTTTEPVGVLEPLGVAFVEVSADVSVSCAREALGVA